MTPNELKIVIGKGTFQGVSLSFFIIILSLILLMIALVLTRDSNNDKTQDKSKKFLNNFQIFVMIIAVWVAIFIKLSSRMVLVNSSSGERIATGNLWEVKKIRKDILWSFEKKEQEKSEKGNKEGSKKDNKKTVKEKKH